jgi:hypothetical protein
VQISFIDEKPLVNNNACIKQISLQKIINKEQNEPNNDKTFTDIINVQNLIVHKI